MKQRFLDPAFAPDHENVSDIKEAETEYWRFSLREDTHGA